MDKEINCYDIGRNSIAKTTAYETAAYGTIACFAPNGLNDVKLEVLDGYCGIVESSIHAVPGWEYLTKAD